MLVRVVALLLPHGGQRRARRNAWAAMSEGAVRARARREAAAWLEVPASREAARG